MATKQKIEKKGTFGLLLGKVIIFAAILSGIIIVLEKKQIFVEDDPNSHIEWKWEWYCKMKQANVPIDVLFIGNSHLLTGFDPYVFTKRSGLNSFLLGAPGVGVADLYYTLEAALKIRKPGIVVLETYAINSLEPFKLEKGDLNDQINSFRPRENNIDKVLSTFSLFRYNNYPIAWCETFRNHNFIFTKPDQIIRNLKGEGPRRNVRKGVYLGQFSRFKKGLSESTLKRYKMEGAPVDGNNFKVSGSSVWYTRKIAQLCKKNGIQFVMLTVPMYHEHVKNYDVWKERLSESLGRLTPFWLDIQSMDLKHIYTADAFEDTYEENQHLTGYGMKLTADIFAQYISHTMPKLPNRKKDRVWADFVARFPY